MNIIYFNFVLAKKTEIVNPWGVLEQVNYPLINQLLPENSIIGILITILDGKHLSFPVSLGLFLKCTYVKVTYLTW